MTAALTAAAVILAAALLLTVYACCATATTVTTSAEDASELAEQSAWLDSLRLDPDEPIPLVIDDDAFVAAEFARIAEQFEDGPR